MTAVKTDSINYKWHLRFLRLAAEVASWSKDPSTKVGCVIARPDNRIVSLGFNGLPSGIRDSVERLTDRELKLSLTIHAEENALLFAQQEVAGCIAYITRHPCSLCAAKLIQAGIREVFYLAHTDFESRWGDNLAIACKALREADIHLEAIEVYHLES